MAETDLQQKRARAAELRQNIKDEQARRISLTSDAANQHKGAILDREVERLERELEAEKSITEAQERASQGGSQESGSEQQQAPQGRRWTDTPQGGYQGNPAVATADAAQAVDEDKEN